jgi:hypothetical protein
MTLISVKKERKRKWSQENDFVVTDRGVNYLIDKDLYDKVKPIILAFIESAGAIILLSDNRLIKTRIGAAVKQWRHQFACFCMLETAVHSHKCFLTFMFHNSNIITALDGFLKNSLYKPFMLRKLFIGPAKPLLKLNIPARFDHGEINNNHEHINASLWMQFDKNFLFR